MSPFFLQKVPLGSLVSQDNKTSGLGLAGVRKCVSHGIEVYYEHLICILDGGTERLSRLPERAVFFAFPEFSRVSSRLGRFHIR